MVHFFALLHVLSTALARDFRARLRPVTVAHKFGAALGCRFAALLAIGLSFVRVSAARGIPVHGRFFRFFAHA